METKIETKFEYTNTCTCQSYDAETDEYFDTNDCYGDCWEYTIEDFSNITEHLFDQNETMWWKVSNLRLWDGDTSGFAYAKTPAKLIEAMTVNSMWTMRGAVLENTIEYSLSHHDSPMGSSTTLSIITEEEREKWGLY